MIIFFNYPGIFLGDRPVHLTLVQPRPIHRVLEIVGANIVKAESCQYLSLYDSVEVAASNWRVVSGGSYATIDSDGLLTALPTASGSAVEIACDYDGLTTSKSINVTYVSGSTTETQTSSEITIDPETGEISEVTTTITTTVDAQGNITVETNISEIITEEDGSSSKTDTTVVSNPDGSAISNSTQTDYDENGNVTGSTENTTNYNVDGSSDSTTIRYDENGDPETKTNEGVDVDGNVSTQNIEYDENGDEVVTGYTIDTSASEEGEKDIEGGVNTEYYAFDSTKGFILNFHFTIDFANQPADQDENHHNILTAKRANPSPWYGFQLRQSSTNTYIQLGTQFSSGSNTNTRLDPSSLVGNVAEYDLKIIYDPTATSNRFICKDMSTNTVVYSSDGVFPDLEELKYLTVSLGCALDANDNPYRYSSIVVKNFSIIRIGSAPATPVISCNGRYITITCEDSNADVYYRLNQSGKYKLYTSPIVMDDDVVVQAYSEYEGHASVIVTRPCTYEGLHKPTILCDGEIVTITCKTTNVAIYYRLNQQGQFVIYSAPIQIIADTYVETYSELSGETSDIVSETCVYDPTHDYSSDYLTFRIRTSGSIAWKAFGTGYEKNIQYSINGGSWNTVLASSTPTPIVVEENDIVRFKGTNATYAGSKNNYAGFEGSTAEFDVEGNIMSLIYGDDFADSSSLSSSYNFCSMFKKSPVVSAENLVLPADTLTQYCYRAMFSLAPSLSKAPNLPATNLAKGCYWYMFEGCPISKAPDLEASTLADESYGNMFISCSNLGYIRCLATDTSASSSLTNWVARVAGTGVFVKASGSSWTTGASGIPNGWEVYDDGDEPEPPVVEDGVWVKNHQEVVLPNSINAFDGHSSNYAKGLYAYTSSITLNEVKPTHMLIDHADQSSDIYINGTKVTTHWGGYNAFGVDVTEYLHTGSNEVVIVTNNTTRTTIAPIAGDFNFNATLGQVEVITGSILPSLDYGYDGFHISASVTSASAEVAVKTSIPTLGSVTCSIDDGTYHYAASQSGTGSMVFSTTIQNPHLWDGTNDPHLYTVSLEIRDANGDLCYTSSRPYGFRYFEYVRSVSVSGSADPYTGFLLNGHPYLLRGVCLHQDIEGKANALTSEDIAHDFQIIQELGCNFIRTAHYPHPREFYDWCDRLGIVVQTEVPWVNKAQSDINADYYTHLESQVTDMVVQHYNHPSIFFWGLANEITTDDKDFAKGKINGYCNIIRNLDTSRWIGYVVSHSYPDGLGAFNVPDVDYIGQNLYVGWYIDQNTNNPTNRLNTSLNYANNRNRPMALSEYGCGGTQRCHSDDFMNTTTRGNNPRHDIEYMMWLHEGHIAAIKNLPQLLSTSQWVLFDFAVTSRQEGYTICLDGENTSTNNDLKRLNNKGLVERDHITKKDPFYLYKAWWNQSDKFVHICGKNYTKFTDRVIKCYTNDGSSLTLFVNNTSVETVTVTDNIATFTARNFSSGDVIKVQGDTTNDTLTVS